MCHKALAIETWHAQQKSLNVILATIIKYDRKNKRVERYFVTPVPMKR